MKMLKFKKNYDSELKFSTIDNQLFHKINNFFSPFGMSILSLNLL